MEDKVPSQFNAMLVERISAIRLIAFDFDWVFTDNSVYAFQDGSEAVRCFRGDGIDLEKLSRMGIRAVIFSSEGRGLCRR